MFPGLTVPEHRQTATKRIAAYCACVSVSFLAAVLFGFHRELQAPKNILADRRISAVPAEIQPQLPASYGKLPLSFEVNHGQTDPQVKFLSRGRGYTLFLAGDGVVLSFKKPSTGRQSSVVSRQLSMPGEISDLLRRATDNRPRTTGVLFPPLIQNPKYKIENLPAPSPQQPAPEVVRLRLVGANANAAVTGGDELPGKANYFIGNDPKKWRTNLPTYATVRYQNVYPGVDLAYYGNQGGQLEYDFVVAPGADPNKIKLSFTGADGMRVDAASGDLVLKVGDDEVRFQKPLVYQPAAAAVSAPDARHSSLVTRHCSFVLASNNQVAFRVAGYDPKRALVIDPVLSYSTYLGGSDGDYGRGIAVDSSGNAYVTGMTASTDFPTANPLQATYGGSWDAFVAKLNAAGSALVYSTYLGGSNSEAGSSIAVDSSGNAYVTGGTASTDFPTVNPLQATNKTTLTTGNGTAFVAKLNSTGSALVYSTYLGGSNSEAGNGIAVDSSGNAYVTGYTASTDFPTANPLQATYRGSGDAFVAKLNVAGSALVYSTYLGGSNDNGGRGIAVDSSGNAYVTGYTRSADFPTVNPLQATNKAAAARWGNSTAFVARLNSVGSALVYSTYLGGSGNDGGDGIAVDSSGNAYVTGFTASTDFPTANPLQATNKAAAANPGSGTPFVAKLNSTGSALVYSTYLGGSGGDEGNGIAVDSSGNAYVTGYTASTDFPTADPLQATNHGSIDAFVAKLNAAGSALTYSTYLGGSGYDDGNGIAVDSSGNAYVTGVTGSTYFPTLNALQATNLSTGSYPNTAFVAKLSPAPAAGLSTSSLSFGGVLVNATSPEQSVTLTDSGDALLNLTSITASGDFALVTTGSSCPYGGGTVAPGTNCTIHVTFTPTATGSRTGTVTITDNAAGSPQTIGLTGTGIVSAPTVSPGSLTFSNQLVGTTSASQPVTLTNTSLVALNITSLALSNDWTETNNCLPLVASSASCTINVSFQPTAGGSQTGTLTLTDYALNSPQTVNLSGTGLVPVVSLSATSLSFAGQTVSTPSAPQTLTLTNTGTGTLTPLTITTSGDFAQTNNCAGSVAASAGCTISITFTPTAPGNRTGALTLTDNASNSPQTVSLSGTGLGAAASFSPSSPTYSSQLVGTTSSAQQVTLQNTGNQALSITSISLTGADSGDFSLSQNCGSSLAANASCQISVTFTPTARGTRTATVSLADNASDSPQSISLSGTGIAPVANLSPSSLTFPGQFVGTTGLPENVTLTNDGDVPLNISSIQASAQFGASNGCTSSLAAGVGCTISVFFDPSAAGAQTGTLTITDNAPGSPQTIPLSGAGMDFAMSSSTTSQTVAAGQTATYGATVTPQGGLNQTVNLTCSGAPSLSTCAVTPGSVTLNGTASAPVTVTVSTTAGSLAPPFGKVFPPSITGLGRMFWLYAFLALASLAGLAGAAKRRAAYLLGLCLVMMMVWSACGGGVTAVQTTGTPSGTYTLDVSATVTSAATSSKLTHDLKLTLTVD